MYINYLHDRKSLGYPAVKDTKCGVFLNDLMTSESIMVVILVLLIFRNIEPEPAVARNSWEVEALTTPSPNPSPSQNSREYFKPTRQNSGSNGGGSSPSPANDAGTCSSGLTPKAAPEPVNYGLGFQQPKTKKQQSLEKVKQELKESIQEENRINRQREKRGRVFVTLAIKDNMRFFMRNDQLRDKYYHALDLKLKVPETLADGKLSRLGNSELYEERLRTLRDKTILPEAYVLEYGRKLRLHILDPTTQVIEGTFGKNREMSGGLARIQGYHLYNPNTKFNAFFDQNGRLFRTGFRTNRGQRNDIKTNSNMG